MLFCGRGLFSSCVLLYEMYMIVYVVMSCSIVVVRGILFVVSSHVKQVVKVVMAFSVSCRDSVVSIWRYRLCRVCSSVCFSSIFLVGEFCLVAGVTPTTLEAPPSGGWGGPFIIVKIYG